MANAKAASAIPAIIKSDTGLNDANGGIPAQSIESFKEAGGTLNKVLLTIGYNLASLLCRKTDKYLLQIVFDTVSGYNACFGHSYAHDG